VSEDQALVFGRSAASAPTLLPSVQLHVGAEAADLQVAQSPFTRNMSGLKQALEWPAQADQLAPLQTRSTCSP
jgi:hypothetical protein